MQTPGEIELNNVCQQLDNILDDFFDTLKQLLVTRQELDRTMKDGFFLMARARYSMGARSVSSTQYNTDDLQKAFSSVSVTHSSDGYISFQSELAFSKSRTLTTSLFKNCQDVGLSNEDGSECVELSQINSGAYTTNGERDFNIPSGLRRRNLQKDGNDKDESLAVKNDTSAVEDLTSGVQCLTCDGEVTDQNVTPLSNVTSDVTGYGKDPILWFGLLVPQPLRQSQTSFKNAIELLCQIADLQNRLVQNKATYEKKMAVKRELMVLCQKSEVDKNISKELDNSEEISPNAHCPDDE